MGNVIDLVTAVAVAVAAAVVSAGVVAVAVEFSICDTATVFATGKIELKVDLAGSLSSSGATVVKRRLDNSDEGDVAEPRDSAVEAADASAKNGITTVCSEDGLLTKWGGGGEIGTSPARSCSLRCGNSCRVDEVFLDRRGKNISLISAV